MIKTKKKAKKVVKTKKPTVKPIKKKATKTKKAIVKQVAKKKKTAKGKRFKLVEGSPLTESQILMFIEHYNK